MNLLIGFLIAPVISACIIAIAIGIMKWEAKRNLREAEKFNKDWDEKMRRFVHNSLYDNNLSKVEDVGHEDVSDVKLLEK